MHLYSIRLSESHVESNQTYSLVSLFNGVGHSKDITNHNGCVPHSHCYTIVWMDELGFYVPSTVFQSFRDDGRVNMKGSVQ